MRSLEAYFMNTEHLKLFYPGLNNCANYRIPSIITTNQGTLVAAIDARVDRGGDNPNNIDKYVRRSEDNGETWGPVQILVDYPGMSDNGSAACDPAMLQDKVTGTIWMIFNHTPAGVGLWNSKQGIGFNEDGYKLLFDIDGNAYTLRENGAVFDSAGQKTDLLVQENGDVIEADEVVGNIYLREGKLLEARTSFLQAIKSDDDGRTWSKPIDLNFQVKEEWMGFIGAGPGIGIQLEQGKYAGRLVFPIYYNNRERGRMSCCVIYSDDHGTTWKRGQSPNDGRQWEGQALNSKTLDLREAELTECQLIELSNGDLKIFMRNHSDHPYTAVSISSDGGETWGEVEFHNDLIDPICQSSVLKFKAGDGKSYVVWANPAHGEKRINGTVRLSEDEGQTFTYSRVVREGGFGYSCLAPLADGTIGLLYEPDDEPGVVMFTKFSIDWIKGNN
jgi:sialidase-1